MIYLASDHKGIRLRRIIADYLREQQTAITDMGPESDARVNYTDYANKLCASMAADKQSKGILICGSGIGMSMAANRYRHIRAALCTDVYSAKMTRQHNDANVLCLGAGLIGDDVALAIVNSFTQTAFDGGRHQVRVDALSNIGA